MPDLNTTPAGWLAFLERKLDAQAAAVKPSEDYYNGRHKLAFATAKFREAFSRYFPPLANNWMKLVVDAPVSRLRIQGFRFNADPNARSWDVAADSAAWAIWQANGLDAGADIAHTEAIKGGVVNLLVSPPERDGEEPIITVESADQTYVHLAAGSRNRRVAAIKRWIGDDEFAYANVYMPDGVHYWQSVERMKYGFTPGAAAQWRRAPQVYASSPYGVVTMVPLENNPDLKWGGRSDLEVAMPIQDAVNKFCLDMQVSSEFHAFPQRWAAGWEAATDGQGTGVDPSVAMGNSRLVTATSAETKFGEFAQGDVQNYIAPIELYIDHLAAVTQTPAYYLKGKMANMSADALHAADAGLVDRCGRKIRGFSDSWEEVMRVAFLMNGDRERGKATNAETLWKNPEVKSLGQVVDAAVKMRTELSVPVEMCWELLDWSPQKIQQAKAMMGLPESPAAAAALNPNPNPSPPDRTSPGGVVLPA